jgi:RNA polymerase sigma-70 factor, ECF subfamily
MLTLTIPLVDTKDPGLGNLVELAQNGDLDAFSQICRTYETRLLRHAMTLCQRPSLAEELAQETLVEAWRCIQRFNGRSQFFTWLCAILLNRFRNVRRQKRPIPFTSLLEPEQHEVRQQMEEVADESSWPDQAAERREQGGQMLACIQALPHKYQQVVYLRFYVNDSLEGIAATLGCSVGTIKSRLFRALEKLRAMKAAQEQSPSSLTERGVV